MNILDYVRDVRNALDDYYQSTKMILVSLYETNLKLVERVRELEEKLQQYETN